MTQAARPKIIRVMGKSYRVASDRGCPLTSGIMGLHDPLSLDITLSAKLCEEQARQIVVHEILHAIELSLGIDLSERNVCAISSAFYGVIRDNPRLMAWLTSRSDRETDR